MASLREKIEAELEQMEQALRELPAARRVRALTGGVVSRAERRARLYHRLRQADETDCAT